MCCRLVAGTTKTAGVFWMNTHSLLFRKQLGFCSYVVINYFLCLETSDRNHTDIWVNVRHLPMVSKLVGMGCSSLGKNKAFRGLTSKLTSHSAVKMCVMWSRVGLNPTAHTEDNPHGPQHTQSIPLWPLQATNIRHWRKTRVYYHLGSFPSAIRMYMVPGLLLVRIQTSL